MARGVEVTFTRGWRKKKCQQSFQWSEDMKIELIDETHVKLFLDGTRNTWVVITPCEAANVEEELIGRITTKFASYSTACLVAQHEGVCNEYTDIIRNIKAAQEQLNLLESILVEANKQKETYSKQEKFDLAEKSKSQVLKLEQQIKQKRAFVEAESARAEGVRSKAEAEAGPVLDMVQIMQNRVQELFHTRVKSVKDKYKVDDLELEEQLAKMSALVQRAKELSVLVARPVNDLRKAMNVNKQDEDEEEEEEEDRQWANFDKDKSTPDATASPRGDSMPQQSAVEAHAPSAQAAVEVAPRSAASPPPVVHSDTASSLATEHKDEDSDVSDWDLDEDELPAAFAPLEGAEVFMTVEPSTGMVTITPSKSAESVPDFATKAPLGDMVMIRKTSLSAIAQSQREKEEKMTELEKKASMALTAIQEKESVQEELETTTKSLTSIKNELEDLRRKAMEAEAKLADKTQTDEVGQAEQTRELSAIRAEMALLRQQQSQAESQLAEKDSLVENLKNTTESLAAMKAEAERVKAQLADKLNELQGSQSELYGKLAMTAQEKQSLEDRMAEQNHAIEELKAHLEHVNSDLGTAARDALEKSARLKELEQHEVVMAQALEDMKHQTEQEKAKAAELKVQMDAQLSQLENTSKGLLDDLETTKREKAQLHKTVEMQNMTLSELRQHLAQVQRDLATANEDKAHKARELEEVKLKTETDQKLIENLKEQSRVEELKRRELHNLIQEIKGNIRVYIRIRPSLKAADENKAFAKVLGSDDRGLAVTAPEEQSATGKGAVNKKWNFEFDRVFFPEATQSEIFTEISQLVQSALDGYKVCIFAYGQTGSGKTFTMEGPSVVTPETRGMIPRSVEQIFAYSLEMRKKGWEYKFHVSFLEIYCNIIRDLLNEESDDIAENKHEIKMAKKGKETVTVVDGLTIVEVQSNEDLSPLLKKANGQRATSATRSNDRSSRSHSVFTLRISGRHRESGQETEGILNLIDLAGSERIDKSQVTGQRLEETKAINASLTCLGDVIAALAQGAKHVPYRNSKLTYLLQDCFGGGSKTLMFINVAPEDTHLSESLCSLRFGAKVHDCHIGVGKKSVKALDDAGGGAASSAASSASKPASASASASGKPKARK